MEYKPEPVTIQFKTVTPVFVGCGEEVTPLSYLIDGDTLYVLDENKLFAALSPKEQESYLNWIDPILEGMDQANQKKEQARKRNDRNGIKQANRDLSQLRSQLSVEQFFRRRVRVNSPIQFVQRSGSVTYTVKIGKRPGSNGYKAHLKNAQHQPYLPGTELKGALRTALLFAFLENEDTYSQFKELFTKTIPKIRLLIERYNQLPYSARKERNKIQKEVGGQLKWVENVVESEILRGIEKDAKYDLLRIVRVSDSLPFSANSLRLEHSKSVGTGKRTDAIPEVLQLPDEQTGEFRLEVMAHQPEFLGKLGLPATLDFQFLMEACYKHATAILAIEAEYFKGNAVLQARVSELARMNTPQTPLLRLGGGQGQLSITITSWLWARDPDLYEIYRQAVSTMRGWQNTVKDNFPKTRRVIWRHNKPAELLGWLQLIPPVDKQLKGRVDFNFERVQKTGVRTPATSRLASQAQPVRRSLKGRQQGTVKWFNEEKRYGFIKPDGGGEDLFVHKNQVKAGTLNEGNRVSFVVGQGRKGLEAQDVKKET